MIFTLTNTTYQINDGERAPPHVVSRQFSDTQENPEVRGTISIRPVRRAHEDIQDG